MCDCYSNLELYKEFAEEAYSIALHPSGLYILVGFSDKLRLMNLLIDDIRTFKEFTIRGCREVRYGVLHFHCASVYIYKFDIFVADVCLQFYFDIFGAVGLKTYIDCDTKIARKIISR